MSCCGRGTRTPGGIAGGSQLRPPERGAHGAVRPAKSVYFQYTGSTELTAQGPISGRSYRFHAPGSVLPVDPRDRRSLEMVPKLRRVDGPPGPAKS